MEKPAPLRAAILGATGAVGQRFVEILASHPWFEIALLAASERSEGRTYREACRWLLPSAMPERVSSMRVEDVTARRDMDLAFSALAADVAGDVELEWARAGVPVFTNARNHRMAPDVPLLVPEVNADHLELVRQQEATRGFPRSGFIVTNPNCSTTFLATALAPIERVFGLKRVVVVTLQAVSGAGYPGLPSMDILGNVIPFISGEEEKIETETKKILGRRRGESIEPAGVVVSAHANRVPVLDGHTESVSFEIERPARLEDVLETLVAFRGEPQELGLPSAPARPILYVEGQERPQPKLDVHRERAMATLVGRLRPCSVLGFKMTLLGHNTVRGAAGGSVLNAELAQARGLLGRGR